MRDAMIYHDSAEVPSQAHAGVLNRIQPTMKLARLDRGPEIFASIQGEGRNLGRFSVFVRTSLCNLHCTWCDTDYTWNWAGTRFSHVRDAEPGYLKYDKAAQIIDLAPVDVAERVVGLRARNVVLTGGEPLLHQPDLVELMTLLREKDGAYTFETETNGTLMPAPAFDALIDQYNVSPKLANSGNARRIRIRPAAMDFFGKSPKSWFKFVCRPEDTSEVDQLVAQYGINPRQVFLMPLGSDSASIRRQANALVDHCIERGYNFSDRLHIHLFSNRRGT